jgi:hypothetical protein
MNVDVAYWHIASFRGSAEIRSLSEQSGSVEQGRTRLLAVQANPRMMFLTGM